MFLCIIYFTFNDNKRINKKTLLVINDFHLLKPIIQNNFYVLIQHHKDIIIFIETNKLLDIKDSMKIESLAIELKKLEEKSTEDGFWNNKDISSEIIDESNKLKQIVEPLEELKSKIN